jgi:hypothetical protein
MPGNGARTERYSAMVVGLTSACRPADIFRRGPTVLPYLQLFAVNLLNPWSMPTSEALRAGG